MSEEFADDVSTALQHAVAGNTDLDEIEQVLEDQLDRVEELRILRGDS